MTIFEMMKALEACEDLLVFTFEKNGITEYHVDINDFEGFDENWHEVDREFVNEALLDEFIDTLRAQALRIEEDYYTTYYFDGFRFIVGATSYDI